jgi:hypothetical protein
MTGCTFSGNSAQHFGGGVYNQSTATITGCTITGNAAPVGGGMVTGLNARSTLNACTISGNTAQVGAGLENFSSTMLTNCTISGNAATASGGGVSNSGTATLTFCTISGNVATVSSGGFFNHDFLDNRGSATLTDTIVAGNTAPGGAPSDIGGQEASRATGSFDMIGTGGSGGILVGRVNGNIVLASLAGLGLAPLGDYGGPTQTVALLPGSPALGAGADMSAITTDQRGEPLDVSVDIGAFQSQGFILTAAPGTSPQSAPTGEAFANPLAVTVVASNPIEPVDGGILTYAVTRDGTTGAGADLSSTTAVIGANHRAQVSAIANANQGTYIVTVSTADALSLPQITLTNLGNNLVQLQFSGLINEAIVFGTAAVTLTGTLASGALAPPAGETVAVTLGGETQQAVIGAGGAFTTTFATAELAVPGAPYTITYRYATDGTFASLSTTRTLDVTQATPTVGVTDAGGKFHNTAFPATATVKGVNGASARSLEGIAPVLTYYSGTITSAAQLAGRIPLAAAPSQAGAYAVVARFPGSTDYLAAESAPVNFTITRAGTHVILVRHPVFKNKRLVSVRLTAEVESLVPGAGIPSGVVKFTVKKNSLGALALKGGQATLTVKGSNVLKNVVTVLYSGNGNFLPSQTPASVLIRA